MRLGHKGASRRKSAQRAKQREYRRNYKVKDPDRYRAKRRQYETTPAMRAYKAALKARLREDPVWRAKERARNREYGKTAQKKALQRFLGARWRAQQAGAAGIDYCTDLKIQARFAYYLGHCAYCGVEGATHIDHLIPLCRGGSAFPANLVPSCRRCNMRKGWRKPSEFGVFPRLP